MIQVKKMLHVAIAVNSLEESLPLYTEVFGFLLIREEVVEQEKVKVALLQVGELYVELLEPLVPDSPVARFIERRGEGLHHIAYEVDKLEKCLHELEAKGVPLLDPLPKPGADGQQIAFLHPQAMNGVLVELCERFEDSSSPSV